MLTEREGFPSPMNLTLLKSIDDLPMCLLRLSTVKLRFDNRGGDTKFRTKPSPTS
jgi:hypothetical protein